MLLEIYKITNGDIGLEFGDIIIIYDKQEKVYAKFGFFKRDIKEYDKETELEIFITDIWKLQLHNYNVPFRSSFEITNKRYHIFFEI